MRFNAIINYNMQNLLRIIKNNIAFISIAVFSFSISFDPDWNSKGLIFLIIVSIANIKYKKEYLQNTYMLVLLITILYITINMIASKSYTGFSSYTTPALSILFYLLFTQTKIKFDLKSITTFLTLGVFIVGVLNLVVFFTNFTANLNFIDAWYTTTVFDIHKTYYGSLLNISFLLLLYLNVQKRVTSTPIFIVAPIFLILLGFSGSVTNSFIFIVLIVLFVLYKYLPRLYSFTFLFLLGGQLLIILALSTSFGGQLFNAVDGDESRIRNFKVNTLVMKQAPFFGYGIGNELDTIQSFRKKTSWEYINKYNAHNQFFQYTIGGGVFYLLLCLFPLLYINIKNKTLNRNLFANGLTLIFCYIFMIESFLVRHHGQIMFSFFVTLIAYKINFDKHK